MDSVLETGLLFLKEIAMIDALKKLLSRTPQDPWARSKGFHVAKFKEELAAIAAELSRGSDAKISVAFNLEERCADLSILGWGVVARVHVETGEHWIKNGTVTSGFPLSPGPRQVFREHLQLPLDFRSLVSS